MNEYKFSIKKYILDALPHLQLQNTYIEITNNTLAFELVLKLVFVVSNNQISILDIKFEDISFNPNNITNQSIERKNYLKYYFRLNDEFDVIQALSNLKDKLNNNEKEELSIEWSIFATQFQNWFNEKLLSIAEDGIKMHQKCFNNKKN